MRFIELFAGIGGFLTPPMPYDIIPKKEVLYV